MITKDDWNDALDAWIVEERERLGGPPSPEDVVAYLSGELPPSDAARVRALLVYYPELTPLLSERIEKPRARRRPFVLRTYAIAATLVIALLGMDAMQQRRRSAEPAVPSHHTFEAPLSRGPESVYELPAGQPRYVITAVPTEPAAEREYELEITRDRRVLWRAKDVRPIENTFVVDIPGTFLSPGMYALKIRADGKLVDHYPFRVTR